MAWIQGGQVAPGWWQVVVVHPGQAGHALKLARGGVCGPRVCMRVSCACVCWGGGRGGEEGQDGGCSIKVGWRMHSV